MWDFDAYAGQRQQRCNYARCCVLWSISSPISREKRIRFLKQQFMKRITISKQWGLFQSAPEKFVWDPINIKTQYYLLTPIGIQFVKDPLKNLNNNSPNFPVFAGSMGIIPRSEDKDNEQAFMQIIWDKLRCLRAQVLLEVTSLWWLSDDHRFLHLKFSFSPRQLLTAVAWTIINNVRLLTLHLLLFNTFKRRNIIHLNNNLAKSFGF